MKKWGEVSIVFTNGCFDILHLGHLDYLFKAAKLGDKLIVGLNSDASISRIKGDNRPILDEKSRGSIIASLLCVDAVILFEEETPQKLIEFIQPNILVKGADYQINNIVGSDFVLSKGGKVQTIPFLEGYSSTAIINKVKNG
jgi:rfaE bifunctional protein nucleotidyltransferase chain/domain